MESKWTIIYKSVIASIASPPADDVVYSKMPKISPSNLNILLTLQYSVKGKFFFFYEMMAGWKTTLDTFVWKGVPKMEIDFYGNPKIINFVQKLFSL